VNASDANTTVARRTASYVGGRPRVIRLAINSKQLMVAGRFDHWVPVAMEGNGAETAAQVLFDVTGMAGRAEDEELFSFEATEVKRVGDLAFVAKGTLRQGETERTVDVVVQTPMAHTPFVALTFPLEQSAFPEIWADLAALVAGTRNDGQIQMTPRAWLTAPALATA
jgi:hypothetical protein